MSRSHHHCPNRTLSSPRLQIPHILCFSSVSDEGSDSDGEIDGGSEGGDISRVKSSADPMEVDRVYKVIDELFALDRNMEVVLDQCGIQLSHDLVVDVLERFRHARKSAFRTRQFEAMVSMLDEMGEKGVLNMETFIIAIRASAASKERKKAVGLFELMKKHKFKIGVDTINCLLDALGREKLGKEAQKLFETLEGRITPNIQTYSLLLNGWCRLKNLLEAGRVWNEMIDSGFKPDIVAHNTMIDGLDLCKQGKMEQAVGYFGEMLDSGCNPDAAFYTCSVTGYGNLKRMDKVYGSLVEMKDKGCPPDAYTYNALIKLMSNRRMPDDSVMIHRKMIQNGVWEVGGGMQILIEKGMKAPQLDYNKSAADFSRAGRPDILEELARKMKCAGKFEVTNFFARWGEMMKKMVKRRDPVVAERQYI
ncbi:Pentatricopeptide repeat [Dillenia turbinata]|uniref:Pentatricopeptide repeat n=1 Tax=Dillenia turbinata TaxID=194707 RepID=A0AAN8ZMI8_9MAGN